MAEDFVDEAEPQADAAAPAAAPREPDEAERRLVAKIKNRIKEDRKHHAEAFDVMRRDMKIARLGASDEWSKNRYTANITGRHIRQLVSTLYAKNPKSIARRRPRLDFEIWDESEESLVMATQVVEQFSVVQAGAAGAAAAGGGAVDPMTGAPVAPAVPPEVLDAQALLADFQQGMTERKTIEKVGKTLEVLFEYYCKEQKPVDFKTSMKQAVRRAATCGVAYVEVGFQRMHERQAQVTQQIADVRAQVERIRVLTEDLHDPEQAEQKVAEKRELELSLAALQQQEYVLIREGLVFDFPEATRVIPSKRCRVLTGFVGADWLTIEYLYTPEEVRRLFSVDVGKQFTPYTDAGKCLAEDDDHQPDLPFDDGDATGGAGMVCVWKHYDRVAGLVYYVADGHKAFLRPPAGPDVYVEGFWPVHALTFNEVEDPEQLFPPSDVALILHMQLEYNRSRQGKREHRQAARPRFMSRKGALDDEAKEGLGNAEPFSVTEVNPTDGDPDLSKLVQAIPVPGVDPNLYDVNEIMQDMQMVVGRSPAQIGPSGKATATGEAIAEEASTDASGSAVDDLDGFLSALARDAGQVMLRELAPETVRKLAGRGAVWPQLSLEDLAGEVYLEIEAGSSGKPNAAQEIRNWREMLPFLIQMPGINPMWLVKESLRRLDDRMDLTDAIGEQFMAIVAMNRTAGSQMGDDPTAAPDAQGDEGGQNGAPAPSPPAGGERGMGDNRT